MNRIDGMPTEFEWKIFTGITTLGLIEKIQSPMRDLQCQPEHFKDRNIFMSMYNDFERRAKGNTERCEYNSQTDAKYARKFTRGHWSFLRGGSEGKWYGTYTHKPNGSWDQTAENMMANFSESGHPIFRASGAFERGELRSKGHDRSLHTATVAMKTSSCFSALISANQLRIYGAVADLRNELSEDFRAREKLETPDHLETMEIPIGSSIAEPHNQCTATRTWCKNTSENSKNCAKTRNYPNML